MACGLAQTLKPLSSSYHLSPLCLLFLGGLLSTFINSHVDSDEKMGQTNKKHCRHGGVPVWLFLWVTRDGCRTSRKQPYPLSQTQGMSPETPRLLETQPSVSENEGLDFIRNLGEYC